jgi:hypothetical protein
MSRTTRTLGRSMGLALLLAVGAGRQPASATTKDWFWVNHIGVPDCSELCDPAVCSGNPDCQCDCYR